MRLFSALVLAGLSILGSQAMSSMELTKNMKIGWSLGNTLDANCADTLNYASDQTASETCWGNVKTTEALFTTLMKEGFDTFRIPTTWDGHFGEGPSYTINSTWMKRVHEVVDYAYKNGAYVILNIHHEKWNYAFANNLQKAQTILVAIWKQIAAEFADYDEHLIFEGLNEPRKVGDAVEWTGGDSEGWDFVNQMNELFVKTIRGCGGKNASRHLMIPTYAATVSENAINAFKFPSGDPNLIVSLHAYTPYNFALNNGDGAVSTFNNPSELDSLFNLIKSKFISKNIPVIIGEFGAMSRNNDPERAKWAEAYTKGAKAIGVPCVVWDNGVFEGTGERFGLIDRSSLQLKAPTVVQGLMKGIGSTGPVTPTNKPAPAPAPEQNNNQDQTQTQTPEPVQPVQEPTNNDNNNNNNNNNNSESAPLPPADANPISVEPPSADTAPVTNQDQPQNVEPSPAPLPDFPGFNNNGGNGGFPGFGGNNNNNNNGGNGGFPGFGGNNNNNGGNGGFPGFGGNNGGMPNFGDFGGFGGNTQAPSPAPAPANQDSQAQAPTTEPVAPQQPEQPQQPQQPVAQPSSSASGDYFTCSKDDWDCKQTMASKCYKDADDCWTKSSGGDYKKCEEYIETCNKIWIN